MSEADAFEPNEIKFNLRKKSPKILDLEKNTTDLNQYFQYEQSRII